VLMTGLGIASANFGERDCRSVRVLSASSAAPWGHDQD
jgi:hypothetical protein